VAVSAAARCSTRSGRRRGWSAQAPWTRRLASLRHRECERLCARRRWQRQCSVDASQANGGTVQFPAVPVAAPMIRLMVDRPREFRLVHRQARTRALAQEREGRWRREPPLVQLTLVAIAVVVITALLRSI
jgi:hypothetical protein